MAGRGVGLQRTSARKNVESEEVIQRPKMVERKSLFGNLMSKASKIKDTNKKRNAKKLEIPKEPEEPVLRQAQPSTATRPSHPSVLSSYTLEELKVFCQQSNIDFTQYEGQTDEKKLLVAALAETYPPDPVRHYYLRMIELEEYVKTFKENLADYKKHKEQAKQDNIPFSEKAPTHSEDIMEEVNNTFHLLLSKFEVNDIIKAKLMKSFSIIEKIQHLRNAVCVLDNDQNFMQEDEDMITIMDSDRFIDSIRLLTCKYRIMNSTPEWLSNFCTSGGISVLVENMDNRLDKDPMEATDAAALLQLIYCLKHIMQTDGLNVAIATRGAIDAFCMSLRFEYQTLALEVLEILAVVCTFGGSEGVTQTVMGFHHLARVRGERPFAVLVDALHVQNPQMQAAVLALVNAMMTVNVELTERISYRNDLRAVSFNERVKAVSSRLNGAKETRGQDLLRMESIARLENRAQSIRFQPGMSISHADVEKSLAEDGKTVIHPEQGVMAGICWEAKKSKSGVKKRWYQVKDGVFSWYHLEERQKDINCEPNGHQSMASVVEIMGYSTSPDLQRMFKYCFVFQCSDGQRYQFGVQDQITKQRWIVALQTSMSRASQERTAYTIESRILSKETIREAKAEFNKQLEIYNGIEMADRELFITACKEGSIFQSHVIAGYLQQDLLVQGPEHGKLLEADYLKMLTELLIALSDAPLEKIQNILADITTAIHTPRTNVSVTELLKKVQSTTIISSSNNDLDTLLAENEVLRAKLQSTPEKKAKSRWKEMLSLAKAAKQSRPSFVFGRSTSKATETTDSGSKPADEESHNNVNLEIHEATQLKSPLPPTDELKSEGSPKSLASPVILPLQSPVQEPPPPTQEEAPSEVKPTPETTKVAASGALANMFAGRGAGPAPSQSGRGGGGRGDALAGLFAGRGPPQETLVKPAGVAGRGAGLAGLFAGRGTASPVPKASSGAMKFAVISSRPIPIPPFLPGQALQTSSGAPALPGQVAVQSVLPPKPKVIPNVKMRQLQWLPLKPKEAVNTLWTEIQEPAIDPFISELENGYGIASKNDDDPSQTKLALSEKKQKPKKESLFDGRRTQNIAITVGKLKMSPDELATLVTELNPDYLTADVALTLLPLCPTPDDIKLIRGYEGKDEDLDVPGRVMSRLVDIPRLEQRLKTHITTLTWEDLSNQLESKLDSLGDAVAELRDDSCLPSLKEILSLILAIGNYMNGGTNKGQAHGIRLNGLLKLVECRKNGSKTETLLHQVVKLYRSKHTDDQLFYTEWENVWTAKSLSLKQLELELKELDTSLQDVKKELSECDKIVEEALRAPLKENLNAFLAFALEKQQKTVETFNEVKKYVTEIRQYFGDTATDKEEDAAQNFFKIMTEFAVHYMKALKDIDEWAEQERKAKEANEKAEADRQRRASLVTLNVGLLKTNHAPTLPTLTSSASISGVNAFRLYQEEQAKSSEDRISYFKKQMMDRRGALTQSSAMNAAGKGLALLEETESEDDESEEEWAP